MNRLSPEDSILKIKGISGAKGTKLNEAGIYQVRDLLSQTEPIKGLDIEKLKLQVRPHVSESKASVDDWSTTNHSWHHKVIHRVNKKGRIVRTKVFALGISKSQVYFRIGKRSGIKRCTPVLLASLHRMWAMHEIISDDDGILKTDRALPPLSVHEAPEEKWQLEALKLAIHETNTILLVE